MMVKGIWLLNHITMRVSFVYTYQTINYNSIVKVLNYKPIFNVKLKIRIK